MSDPTKLPKTQVVRPMYAWIMGIDGDPDDPVDIKARFEKVSRSIVWWLVRTQLDSGLSNRAFAASINFGYDNYVKLKSSSATSDHQQRSQSKTLAELALASALGDELRDRVTAMLLHRVYNSSQSVAHQVVNAPHVARALGSPRSLDLQNAPMLPCWARQIDEEDIEFWNIGELRARRDARRLIEPQPPHAAAAKLAGSTNES